MLELEGKPVDFGCFTPEETRLSHALQTAALRSQGQQEDRAGRLMPPAAGAQPEPQTFYT